MRGSIYYSRRRPKWYSYHTVAAGSLLVTRIHLAGVTEPWALLYHCPDTYAQITTDRIGEMMSTLIKKLIDRKKAEDGKAIVANDDELVQLAPTVHELLTTQLKEKGKVYEPACLVVFAGQGCFRATLSNRALDFKRTGEGGSMREAILDLEERVKREEGEARADSPRRHKAARNGDNGP